MIATPSSFSVSLIAREDERGLHYAGSAFVTLGGEERETFWNEVERLRRERPALAMLKRPKTTWTNRTCVCTSATSKGLTSYAMRA